MNILSSIILLTVVFKEILGSTSAVARRNVPQTENRAFSEAKKIYQSAYNIAENLLRRVETIIFEMSILEQADLTASADRILIPEIVAYKMMNMPNNVEYVRHINEYPDCDVAVYNLVIELFVRLACIANPIPTNPNEAPHNLWKFLGATNIKTALSIIISNYSNNLNNMKDHEVIRAFFSVVVEEFYKGIFEENSGYYDQNISAMKKSVGPRLWPNSSEFKGRNRYVLSTYTFLFSLTQDPLHLSEDWQNVLKSVRDKKSINVGCNLIYATTEDNYTISYYSVWIDRRALMTAMIIMGSIDAYNYRGTFAYPRIVSKKQEKYNTKDFVKIVSEEVYKEFVRTCEFFRPLKEEKNILYLICVKDNIKEMDHHEIELMRKIIISRWKLDLIWKVENIQIGELQEDVLISKIFEHHDPCELDIISAYNKLEKKTVVVPYTRRGYVVPPRLRKNNIVLQKKIRTNFNGIEKTQGVVEVDNGVDIVDNDVFLEGNEGVKGSSDLHQNVLYTG